MKIKGLHFILFFVLSNCCFGQLLQWNTFGNAGTETTEPSVYNDPNISATNLTQGTITAAANANRFGGSGWFNTGNTPAGNTLAEAITGNDYVQYIVSPNVGYNFTPTSLVFQWQSSGTGPTTVTLRSSNDSYAADLGSATVTISIATYTITISGLTALTSATTFRLYGYGATATGGTGGFDVATSVVNVQLNGTSASNSPTLTVSPSTLTAFNYIFGAGPSASQSYNLSGSLLTGAPGNITITGSADYEVSSDNITFGASASIPYASATLSATPVYIRLIAGLAVATYNGETVSNAGGGATSVNVTCDGNVNSTGSPAVGDYRTMANGNWGVNTTWEKWNGSAWVACTAGDFPDLGTANVEIRTHTIDLDGTGSPPFDCKNLTVDASGLLWTNHFTGANNYLQIYGNITCDGTIGVSTGDDICFDITGGTSCTISGSGSFYATRMRKDGAINAASNTTLIINMNIFLFWSSASGTILYNDGTNALFDVTVNSGKTLRGITAGAVSNNISMDGVAGLDGTACGGSYTVYGTIDIDGTVYATTNNVNMARPISITIKSGGIVKCAYITASASGVSTSTLTIESGGKLTLTGADGSSNAFSSFSTTNNIYNINSGSTVEYSGIAAQNVESQLTYSNITFAGGGAKTLNGATNVNGIATFTNGLVTSTGTNIFNMSSTSSATGANNLSFVKGPVSKNGSSNFTFPVGKDAEYRPISATSLTGSETFTAEYFHSDPDVVPYDITLKDVTLDDIGRCEYWILNRAGSVNANVTLSWDTYSCGVTSLPDLAVARWDGSMWKDEGNTTTTGAPDPSTGTVTSGTVISFSPFTLASRAAGVNPLPIALLSFTANYNSSNNVDVKWSTASEINNDYFSVERSADAILFDAINVTDGAGNSNSILNYSTTDDSPLNGISYYRLKQTDFDGNYKYSSTVSVQKNENDFEIINAHYTLSQNEFAVYFNCNSNCLITIDLYDMSGKKVYSSFENTLGKNSEITIPAKNLSEGIYLVKAYNGNKLISKKVKL